MKTREQIQEFLNKKIQFLSPNEPITPYGIERVLRQLNEATSYLEEYAGAGKLSISLWDQNMTYAENDLVLFFKAETRQVSPEVGKREFAFILISTKDGNTSIPNYDLVDGLPDFKKSNWRLLNPLSYLLQDTIGLRQIVEDVFQNLLDEHVRKDHRLTGSVDIERNLIKKDYSNLQSPWEAGKYALMTSDDGTTRIWSNGIMEHDIQYSFDARANQQDIVIDDRRYYYQKSPIWDESDQTIFARKYVEDDLFSVVLKNGVQFNSLRYGTNVFNCHMQLPTPFLNSDYCIFFDTYSRGDFVFGYDKGDLMEQEEPSWDAIVSRPMIMNKSASGFDIVLPIHTYLNSIQKWQIGVPWENKFRLQAIGRYR